MKLFRTPGLLFLLAIIAAPLTWAEAPLRKLSVLPTTDSSAYGLGSALQSALSTLYQQAGTYEVTTSNEALPGFTPLEISRMLEANRTELLSFVLLEPERLSIFIFDKEQPLQFIVSTKSFNDGTPAPIDSALIETRFREAFAEATTSLAQKAFQDLPGANADAAIAKNERRDNRIAQETRLLFRELASQTDSSLYFGAQIGMARFGSAGQSSSTVAFGFNGGYQVAPRISVEAGLSASTYLMGSLGARYKIPFAEEIVTLSVGLDAASVFRAITQKAGYTNPNLQYNSPPINDGSLFVGPGIFFDIPLLGAALRGDIRLYVGNGSNILMGTYGFVYYL
ncbi:hypothetical protein EBR03_03615 [bacterium]|nr:hypothetical protein [bacterium]